MGHGALDAEVREPIVERACADVGKQGRGHRFQVEPRIGERAAERGLHRTLDQGPIEGCMKGQQRRRIAVDMRRHGGNGEQAVALHVQAARFDIDDGPAAPIRCGRCAGAEPALQTIHRR